MNATQRTFLVVLILLLLLIVPLGRSMMFTVNEREVVVVRQFRKVVASYTEPGLRFKIPLIQEVQRFPKTFQFWSGAEGEILVDLLTADGEKIEVTPWFIWRITDPKQFVEVLRTVERAENRVKEFVRSEMRDVITGEALAEVVRSTDRELTYTFQVELPLEPEMSEQIDPQQRPASGKETESSVKSAPAPMARQRGADKPVERGREKIVQQVKEAVQKRLSTTDEGEPIGRGIELVDVGIAKIDFVDAVREAAFERLTAFMQSIAARHTSEGDRRKQEILNKTNYEIEKIEGEGKGEANRIKGEVEAEIIEKYAQAIRETGDFYSFIRTLEAYQKAVGPNTRLVLTTDSEMFRLLKEAPPAPPPLPEKPTAEEKPDPKATDDKADAKTATAEKPSP